MKTFHIVLVSLALAGCASAKVSSPRGVVVHAATISQAGEIAEQECGKHRRFARFVNRPQPFNFAFDCVE